MTGWATYSLHMPEDYTLDSQHSHNAEWMWHPTCDFIVREAETGFPRSKLSA